jgi:superfamily II DNA or RNA helicase
LKIIIKNNLKITGIPEEFVQVLMAKLRLQNPKWIENQKMGRWNKGTPKELKFYKKASEGGLVIPRGYIRQLIVLAREDKIQYELVEKRRTLADVEFTFSGQLKHFQQQAALAMLAKEFGILNAATGAGKTVIALYMIAQRRQPSVIVVHTKELAAQWTDRISTFLNIDSEKVGFIGGGKLTIGDQITVAMVQSLYKCADDVAKKTGFLVVDECHRCPSRTFTEAVTAFDSKYMLGLSATPFRRDKLSKLIFWHLGDVHHEMDKKRLISKGHILKAEVVFRETDFKPYYDPVSQYSKMLSELTADTKRNLLIATDVANEAKKSEGICLVLSDRKAHCENLHALLKFKFNMAADFLTGDLSVSERQIVLDRLNNHEIKILVATGQLIGEGFDCKYLSTLFFATPIRFSGRVLQYLGRILRPAADKSRARVFDYVDVNVDVLTAAARARQRVYEGQEGGRAEGQKGRR